MKYTFVDLSKNQHKEKCKLRTGTVSKSFTEQDPEPAENIRQFYNRTRNRQIFRVSSRSGTGRNIDPLE